MFRTNNGVECMKTIYLHKSIYILFSMHKSYVQNEEWSGMYEDDFPIPEPEDDAQADIFKKNPKFS